MIIITAGKAGLSRKAHWVADLTATLDLHQKLNDKLQRICYFPKKLHPLKKLEGASLFR